MNIIEYAALVNEQFKNYFPEIGSSYKVFTTFASDLVLGFVSGEDGVKETAERCFKSWKSDYKYFTELVMAMNFLSWFFAETGDINKSKLFAGLYYEYMDKFYEVYSGNSEATDYFFEMTD